MGVKNLIRIVVRIALSPFFLFGLLFSKTRSNSYRILGKEINRFILMSLLLLLAFSLTSGILKEKITNVASYIIFFFLTISVLFIFWRFLKKSD